MPVGAEHNRDRNQATTARDVLEVYAAGVSDILD